MFELQDTHQISYLEEADMHLVAHGDILSR